MKIVGTDLDGTLFTSKKKITENTKRAVESAINRGIVVVPVTGRPYGGLPDELFGIKGINYVITSNGAVTYDIANKSIIEYYGIDAKKVAEIYQIVSKYDMIFEVFQNGYGYEEEENIAELLKKYENSPIRDYLIKSRKAVADMSEFIANSKTDIDGISIMFKNSNDYAEIEKQIKAIPDVNIIENSKTDIEINHKLADKGRAFLKLAEILNIPQNETMAIGDGSNDYSLLKCANFAVAMGNAKSDIKNIADEITDDNDNDGVAKVLDRL